MWSAFVSFQDDTNPSPAVIDRGGEIRKANATDGCFRVMALFIDRRIGGLERKWPKNLVVPAALRVSICVNVKIHELFRWGRGVTHPKPRC